MKKIYIPEQFKDNEQFKFYFDENGQAHQLLFDDDHGHEVDDTCFIKDSNEVYLNGLYFKLTDCVEVE